MSIPGAVPTTGRSSSSGAGTPGAGKTAKPKVAVPRLVIRTDGTSETGDEKTASCSTTAPRSPLRSPGTPGSPKPGEKGAPQKTSVFFPSKKSFDMIMLYREVIDALFEQPQRLDIKVRELFRGIASAAPPLDGLRLKLDDLTHLRHALAVELRIDPKSLGSVKQMFWRFDFSGDGHLDEDESTMFIIYMLQQHKDELRKRLGKASERKKKMPITRLDGKVPFHSLDSKYDVQQKLHEGKHGCVCQAQDKTWDRLVIVKSFCKTSSQKTVEEITAEFGILMTFRHPKIAHVFDIFQDDLSIYIIQDPYFGGDLASGMQEANKAGVTVNEKWLAGVMCQVLAGVGFLHSNHMIHCNLKEKNIMLTSSAAGKGANNCDIDWHDPQVVVIDFGLAINFQTNSSAFGTPGYMPPEVWEQGLWTPRGDVFSLGVMLFSLQTGECPFTLETKSQDEIRIKTRNTSPLLPCGSLQLKALVSSMIQKALISRPSIDQIVKDPWFEIAKKKSQDPDILAPLMKFRGGEYSTELGRALITDLASRMDLLAKKELNNLFVELDTDLSGTISADELRKGLHGKWSGGDIEKLVACFAYSRERSEVPYAEFMGQWVLAQEQDEDAVLKKAFKEADLDGSGALDLAEVRKLLERPALMRLIGDRTPEAVLRELDSNCDAMVSFSEFKRGIVSCNLEGDRLRAVQPPDRVGHNKLVGYSQEGRSLLPPDLEEAMTCTSLPSPSSEDGTSSMAAPSMDSLPDFPVPSAPEPSVVSQALSDWDAEVTEAAMKRQASPIWMLALNNEPLEYSTSNRKQDIVGQAHLSTPTRAPSRDVPSNSIPGFDRPRRKSIAVRGKLLEWRQQQAEKSEVIESERQSSASRVQQRQSPEESSVTTSPSRMRSSGVSADVPSASKGRRVSIASPTRDNTLEQADVQRRQEGERRASEESLMRFREMEDGLNERARKALLDAKAEIDKKDDWHVGNLLRPKNNTKEGALELRSHFFLVPILLLALGLILQVVNSACQK